MLTRRRLLALAGGGITLAAGATVGCGADTSGSTLDRMRRAGIARVGIAGERPFGYSASDGRVTGEAPEVARAVLAALGVGGIEAVQIGFSELIPGLRVGQFDIITAGLTVTPRRCQRVLFSRPDFLAPTAFLVQQGNPDRISTFDDVRRRGLTLGVLSDSVEQEYARAAGIRDAGMAVFEGQTSLFRAVEGRRVPVGALTRISLLDEIARNPGSQLEVTDDVRPVIDGREAVPAGAFAFREGDRELRDAFDVALTALQDSGEWLRLTAPFGFTAENLPPRDLTTAMLCERRTRL
ncbi:ectoine/hydroxyectoine ABC transporter substrate-binding protein EhuB [Pseudonocardia bannensis]|uniref:Ectoine/hydroxyectoine ABC transporter substrate-binding protein EhuB n=1 Tax=Pseudonocardia bannensis TaxID=630973 RepID=A0A848DHW6_9PSEU|nr:ectoine/hydroxyectoine ABC transporter substrate-binding protein EhuB [Pseudonocardia bannensis]NMH92156.1 ectoine/hydroxyectoine ABC transporter substrate-binding protein EhuB [Pseudonocardia bannensis]